MLRQLGACEFTPKEELLRRIKGLKAKMAETGIDFAVILQNVDLFYFAGTIQKGAMVIPVDHDPILFIEKSLDRARMETGLEITPIKRDKDMKDILQGRHVLKGKGGMELDVVPVANYERFKGVVGFDTFVDISGAIKEIRMIKSPFELEQVRHSARICDRIFERAKEVVHEGVREVDIDAELVAEGRRHGHQGYLRMRGFNQEMMSLYVTAGVSGTIPSCGDVPVAGLGVTHALAQGSSMKKVERGVPVMVDYGAGYNGYITDETRPFVVGELKEIFRKPYEVAREIVEETTAFGREGVNATEIYTRAYEKVKSAGLTDHFMGYGEGQVSFIGHGLGLEINELPVITPRHDRLLQEGMVFAYEPKFIFPGEGVIGIEVDFIVHKDGIERVTATPIDVVYV